MAKLFEKHPVSDHIRLSAFPAAAQKGEIVMFGALRGISDYNTAAGEPGSVDTGKEMAVFQAATADLTDSGTLAAVGANVYLTAAKVLTTAVGTSPVNTLFGTIVNMGTDTFDIAITS
jgi:predicted RecA/RadA family phage recombinase